MSDPLEINGDEEKLKSVFINLIDNAIKYSGKNGYVSIDLTKHQDGRAKISITDNGPGMKEEEINRIFKRFYRSDEIRSDISGSGLGLSIAKKIIELHKGEIKVQSSPGKGSTFSVFL
ncbi:MAG: ATP-binding protein [Ignavibacteriaceae bacterium]